MLEINNLRKTYPGGKGADRGTVVAVDDVSVSIGEGEFLTLLGPSGCGKTTTLRSVAGLEQPDAGEIRIADRLLYSSTQKVWVKANDRGLGMVFQSYAIWPHMNVFKNIAFPLQLLPRARRPSRAEIKQRVERVLSVVGLDGLETRSATDLSGGQQQRLALARALVVQPPLLLLDEPLSNLDAKLRESMRFELKRLQRELGITAAYVTHDQAEALSMSTTIAVMEAGKVVQLGRPRDIYEKPASRFVADFIGTANFLPGSVDDYDAATGRATVTTSCGSLRALAIAVQDKGSGVIVSIRPESIELVAYDGRPSTVGCWRGVVETRAFLGEAVDHLVLVEGTELRVRCNPSVSFPPGTEVAVVLSEEMATLVPSD